MADFINAGKLARATIVYAGPGLSGKTTNALVMANILGRPISGVDTAGDRTLLFDLMSMKLDDLPGGWTFGVQVKTVPGQVQYVRARRMVLKRPDAIVFVADSSEKRLEANRYALDDVQRVLLENGVDPGKVPVVMQYNKRDVADRVPVDELQRLLNPAGAPAWTARARDAVGVFGTLRDAVALARENVVRDLAARVGAPIPAGSAF